MKRALSAVVLSAVACGTALTSCSSTGSTSKGSSPSTQPSGADFTGPTTAAQECFVAADLWATKYMVNLSTGQYNAAGQTQIDAKAALGANSTAYEAAQTVFVDVALQQWIVKAGPTAPTKQILGQIKQDIESVCGSFGGPAVPPSGVTDTAPSSAAPSSTVGGATVVNCKIGSEPESRPKRLYATCGDGGIVATDITWTSWGGPTATGTGVLNENLCDPSCAEGTEATAPATVLLTNITGGRYTKLTITPTPGNAGGLKPISQLLPN